MNNQQFERLVHNLKGVMRCPHCASEYTMEDIHYLGQLDNMTFLHMKCSKCKTPVFASVSFDGSGDVALEDITADDIALADTPSPAADLDNIGFEQRELEPTVDMAPTQKISVENIPADKLLSSLNPISYDNVLDVHEYLKKFDGDFDRVLK
ncbi:hypothetical protein DRH29_01100 [candidate division Kazan bacterium]|uniref:Uncharacterized protein n=1 Tax=candidate division Kazan bacterium TaxID=2202143 RepID=A0A420ZDF6_UNCK3|nr:MAG: hypothetical protein DRH29_01100 [candidate division Kazan bacterium]